MNSKSIIAIVFSLLLLVALGVFVYIKVLPQTMLFASGSLSVATGNTVAQVYLNGKLLGVTPLKKTGITSKKAQVRVASSENAWEGELSFTPGTETALNLDLGTGSVFSGADNVWLDKVSGAAGLSIITDPGSVLVTIDGTDVGKTPLSINIKPGAHIVKLSVDNYQSRSLNLAARENYHLGVSSHLFLLPIPSLTELTGGPAALKVFNLSGSSPLLSADTHAWAQAVSYWQRERETSPSAMLNYFVDSSGNLFDREGTALKTVSTSVPAATNVGYLSTPTEKTISALALKGLQKLASGPASSETLIKILPTGATYLRVRNSPSGTEIGKATVGQTYPKLAEQTGWVQIKLPDGTTGWVSATYVAPVVTTPTQ
ncbi:MAG: PEGA domain-containing protein [candidate division WWE3 bacterium]|nr:PEGA domain-containing protein [candidate division WWE3 bacterium]